MVLTEHKPGWTFSQAYIICSLCRKNKSSGFKRVSSSITKTSLVSICLRLPSRLFYCIWICQHIGMGLLITLFRTMYHLGTNIQIVGMWLCQGNLIPQSKLCKSVINENKPSWICFLTWQDKSQHMITRSENHAKYLALSPCQSMKTRQKTRLFYMGRAGWDYINIMKEAGFPKP